MSSVAAITLSYSLPSKGYGILLPAIFEKWHRAKNLGLELVHVEFDGYPIGSHAIERLNLWLAADGAWRASLLSHFEAEKVLGTVIRRNVALNVGGSGGGRWASGSTAKEVFRNAGDGVQGELGPKVG